MLKQGDDGFPIERDAERQLDRRRFLCGAGAALVAVAAGRALANGRRESEPAPIAAASIASLLPGEPRVFRREAGNEVLAVRLLDGQVVAYDRRCPHLGCPVIWAAERERFECPCHHAAFDAHTGEVLFGPPRRGLRPVTVRA